LDLYESSCVEDIFNKKKKDKENNIKENKTENNKNEKSKIKDKKENKKNIIDLINDTKGDNHGKRKNTFSDSFKSEPNSNKFNSYGFFTDLDKKEGIFINYEENIKYLK